MQPQPISETQELANQFADSPKDLRDWAEALAYKNLEMRVASGAAIGGQATTTLTVLLAVLGGCGTLAVRVLEPAAPATAWGALACAAYLAGLVLMLVHSVMRLRDAPPVYNRPGNLIVPGATLEQVRVGELANLDRRIREQTDLNAVRATALNRIRLAAAAAPLVFGAAAWLAKVAVR